MAKSIVWRRVAVVVSAITLLQLVAVVPARAASSWSFHSSNCFARWWSSEFNWIDACWQKHKLTQDGNPNRDYWQLTYYATGGSEGLEPLGALALQLNPNSSPAQHWVDWSPRSDITGSCRSINVGISYVASFSYTAQYCPEKWDITKYTTPGKMQNVWSDLGGTQGEREVALGVVVWTAQGTVPNWSFVRTAGP